MGGAKHVENRLLRHACPGGLMPSWSTRQLMSSSPSSLQAVATPGVAPVTASHSPGAPGVGGGAPALPSSITLKASAQFVGALTASGSSPTTPHARAHFPHSTQTSQRVPLHPRGAWSSGRADSPSSAKHLPQKVQTLQRVPRRRSFIACSPLPAPQHAPEPLAGIGGTELTRRLFESYRTGLSSSGSPGAVLPPGLMKNEMMSAMTESGMTVTQAVPTQPRPASRHAP